MFKKKDYRLLNSICESDYPNTILGVIEKLKRPFSKIEEESYANSKDLKSLEDQHDQIVDFVNKNETECAKILSNNWVPMKRKRTSFN